MRYILCRFKGEPTTRRPPGMNDIVGMREYKHNDKRAAMRDLRPDDDRNAAYLRNGYTHYGLYESPRFEYVKPDPLVYSEEIKP